jgi:hypothetical protein
MIWIRVSQMGQTVTDIMSKKPLCQISWNVSKSRHMLAAAILWLGIAFPLTPVQAENPMDILVIANASVQAREITVDDLRDFFLKKRTNWGSGEKTIPINVTENAKLREAFRERVLNMNSTEEQSYWQSRKIKEGETEPTEFSNTLKAVYKLRGSVSYIYRWQYRQGVVKVILVLPGL